MSISNPSVLHQFLNELGIKPKKGLSQNFLIDGNIIRKMLFQAAIEPNDYVLEIGAGPGALTEALINAGTEVMAVEMDSFFSNALSRFKNVEVFSGDIQDFPLDRLKRRAKVVSNIPYHLTTPILSKLLPCLESIHSLTIMVQEEMARRICAQPHHHEYGSLSVFVNFYATPRYGFRVTRNCFYPKPKIDSAVITLTLKESPHVDPIQFFQLVRTAFQQRRKMLTNSLSELFEPAKIENVLESMGINTQVRAENLSLESFLTLFKAVHSTCQK